MAVTLSQLRDLHGHVCKNKRSSCCCTADVRREMTEKETKMNRKGIERCATWMTGTSRLEKEQEQEVQAEAG